MERDGGDEGQASIRTLCGKSPDTNLFPRLDSKTAHLLTSNSNSNL